MKLHDVKKIKPCLKPSPPAQREGAMSTLSSDFRTVGDIDKTSKKHVAPMSMGKGVEFRIFDHFMDTNIYDLVKLMSFVSENSRVYTTKNYVYDNKHWIKALHKIMKDGWCAELDEKYINELRKNLNLKIKTKSIIAYDILCEINNELYKKHKNGMFTYIMNPNIKDKLDKTKKLFYNEQFKPIIPHINFMSWCLGFLLKLNRNTTDFNKFKYIIRDLPLNKIITINDFEKIVFKHFDKKKWCTDIYNICHFMCHKLNILKINYNKNKTIKSLKLTNRISINIDSYITDLYNQYPDLENIL